MSDIFAEVDEVMRQERLAKFWHDNAPYIIAFVVLTIALTGGISMYRGWDEAQKQQQTALYLDYTEQNNLEAGLSDTELKGNLKGLLNLRAAEEHVTQGENEQAIALYQKIIEEINAQSHIKDLARLMIVRLDNSQAGLIDDIKESSPYFAQALMEKAVLLYNDQNDAVQAVLTLKKLQGLTGLSPPLNNQADDLMRLYQGKTQAEDTE